MKKMTWLLLVISVFGFSTVQTNECCVMEDEMEYCWEIQDLEGFN